MGKFLNYILLAILMVALIVVVGYTSQAQEPQAVPIPQDSQLNQYLNSVPIPHVPAGHILYWLKLWFEWAREKLTFDNTNLLLLKQEHLQNRIDELKFDITYKDSNYAEELLQKIQLKRMEINDLLDKISVPCPTNGAPCVQINATGFKSANQDVLTNLLNDSRMPESSRKGLENAMNKSGMMEQIKADMVQGSFYVSDKTVSMLPFSRAQLYESKEDRWYSIMVSSNKIEITVDPINNPEYYLYPTDAQIDELTNLADKINKQKTITWQDKITLMNLWFKLQKQEVN